MKCCNHLLAVNVAGVTGRELWCVCVVGKVSKDIGTKICKGIIIWLLFGDSIRTSFRFFKCFFVSCFCCL